MTETERSILLFFIVIAMVLLIASVRVTSRPQLRQDATAFYLAAPLRAAIGPSVAH